MCGWTSVCLTCTCIEVGTECQWAIKVILYDVCKWLCYEMSPSVWKRRSVDVTQGWEEMVWWIMHPVWKGVIRLCMCGWVEECRGHSMDVFSHMCFASVCHSLPILSFISLAFSSSSINLYSPNKRSFSHQRRCFSRTPAPLTQNILAYFYSPVLRHDLYSVCYFCSAHSHSINVHINGLANFRPATASKTHIRCGI